MPRFVSFKTPARKAHPKLSCAYEHIITPTPTEARLEGSFLLYNSSCTSSVAFSAGALVSDDSASVDSAGAFSFPA